MLDFLFKVLLTLSSISMLVTIYLIKCNIWLFHDVIPWGLSIAIYIVITILLSFIGIILSKGLEMDSIEGGITNIEPANEMFLPVYLGYFFVALSIPSDSMLVFVLVFAVTFVLLFLSQTMYYNPWFLLFGYRFYNVTNSKSMKILIVTKRQIRGNDELQFNDLRRINSFTFIDMEGNR